MLGSGAKRTWAAGGLAGLAVLLALAAGAAGAACTNLAEIPQNQCGNGIVEQPNGEDCDGIGIGLDGGPSDASNPCSSTCRLLCDGDAGTSCPWGWGCGTDGICRQPTGTFAATAAQINENVEHLLLGDVDGSRRRAVVVDTGTELSVHYVDSTGAVSQTLSFTAVQPSPAVGDYDGDGIDDVAYALENALAVRRGATDRSLTALPFSVDLPGPAGGSPDVRIPMGERLIAIDAAGISASDFKLRELLRLDAHTITTFFPKRVSAKLPIPPLLTLALVGSADMPPGANVPVGYWDEGAACQQFFVANMTKAQLEVYYACTPSGTASAWNDIGTPSYVAPIVVTLPAGFAPAGPVFGMDVDKDGHRDLLVYAASDPSGTSGQIQVAYGDGKGGFGSTPPTATGWQKNFETSLLLCVTDALPAGGTTGCATKPPLAVADFNGDGMLDIVTACGVFTSAAPGASSCPNTLTAALGSQGGTTDALWTQAVIADLNGDGLPDVVVASCADSSITYLENADVGAAPNPSFNPYVFPTVGGIDSLSVGDFDGDLVPDLMYVERSGAALACALPDVSPAPTESLAVIFGAYSGGPSAPAVLAKGLGAVYETEAANLTSTIAQYAPIRDLAVLRADPGDPTSYALLDVFQGNADRQIIAPYFMVAPDTLALDNPFLITMGHFGAGPQGGSPPTGFAVVAGEGLAARLWTLTQANGSLEAPVPLTLTGLVPSDYTQFGGNDAAWLSAIDLGGPPGDEIVGLTHDTSGGSAKLYVLTQANGAWALTPPSPPSHPAVDWTASLPAAYAGPLLPTDIDADGRKDLLLAAPTGALVLWNDDIAAGTGTPIPLAQLQAALGADGKPCGTPKTVVAATPIRAAPGLPLGVLIATDGGAYLASLDPTSPTGHVFTVTCVSGLPAVTSGALLAAGDVDGDGVDDVVVGALDAVQIFRGVPVVR